MKKSETIEISVELLDEIVATLEKLEKLIARSEP